MFSYLTTSTYLLPAYHLRQRQTIPSILNFTVAIPQNLKGMIDTSSDDQLRPSHDGHVRDIPETSSDTLRRDGASPTDNHQSNNKGNLENI